ncbi:hypothetical protein BaRGS_00019901, partial [Batillaria attramentaria]
INLPRKLPFDFSRAVSAAAKSVRNSVMGVSLFPENGSSHGDPNLDVATRLSEGLNAVSNLRSNLLKKNKHSPRTLLASDLKDDSEARGVVPLLTLFSTWLDPDADHDLIRNLTLRNWAQLKPLVVPVVFTNSSRVASRAEENGWHVLPVSRTAVDVPILKYMYMDVMARFNSTLYGYANGDILFTQSLVDTLLAVLTSPQLPIKHRPLLVAGRRTNVMMVQPNETTTFQGIYDTARSRGQMDGPFSIDYFVVDRVAYDNWLIGHAVLKGHLVDATSTLLAVHQRGKKGLREGRRRPNSTYNRKLLLRLHLFGQNRNLNCAPWKTLIGRDGKIAVEKNLKQPRRCRRL